MINITPLEKKYYKKNAMKSLESTVFSPPVEKKYVDKKEKLNRSYRESAAGVMERNKFDEVKNLFVER